MSFKIHLPKIHAIERTPLVDQLLDIIDQIQKDNDRLREEVARAKGLKGKPKLRASGLGKSTSDKNQAGSNNKKRSAGKKSSKSNKSDRTEIVKAETVPSGSRFKGYSNYRVEELILRREVILYRLERWQLADGSYMTASLPAGVSGSHFGPTLRSYVLHQHHHQGVTQPLLLAGLKELKFTISSGQLNNLLIEKKGAFHKEKDGLLPAAFSVSDYVHVDDTGARHQGNNGYCTHIGNELFAWFESTRSKSRINFLTLLRRGHSDYILNNHSFSYMKRQKLAPAIREKLVSCAKHFFMDESAWQSYLTELGITRPRHIKIITEAALIGSVLSHGFRMNTVIMSDDAGQFNIFKHVLCWFHIERNIYKLMPNGKQQIAAVEHVRKRIWTLYQQLKKYKKRPHAATRKKAERLFDELTTKETCYQLLNNQLKKIKDSRPELLMILDRPELPLHNNLSERDIREYVKRRKISGSTRSEEGRRCRDTFASLKKTALKLGVPFWDYLMDRMTGAKQVPWLPNLLVETGKAI